MGAKPLTDAVLEDKKKNRILSTLRAIKPGMFYSRDELAKELGFKPNIFWNWYEQYPEILDYRCFLRQGRIRVTIFVHPKTRKELITKGLAKERY